MTVLNQTENLVNLSINAMCNITIQMIAKGVKMTEKMDDAVQIAEDKMEEAFMSRGTITSKTQTNESKYGSELCSDVNSATLDLLNVKHMVEKHGDFPGCFIKYIKDLPSEFVNEIFLRVLNNFFKVIDHYNVCHIEEYMEEKWAFPSRLRVAFRLLLKFFSSSKISTFDMNQFTNKFFKLFTKYLQMTDLFERNEYMADMEEKNKELFIVPIICFQENMSHLTSISMQHLADSVLIWLIGCQCPNLWYLDVSGNMYDLQRHCVFEAAAGTYVTAVDKNGVRQFKEADFIESLCSLYGNFRKPHKKFEGIPQGCLRLRRLLLPNCVWETCEENALLDEMMKIFQNLPYLEEVTGVCLLYILCKLNELPEYPIMLRLRKFDGKTGGHRLVGIDPKRLQKVKLPLVEEVVFSVNVFMKPVALGIFPNMKHLKVTPYDSRAYSLDSIMPYLLNLVTLDIEFFQEISILNICDLSKQCRLLKSLSITCPALRMGTDNVPASEKKTGKELDNIIWPFNNRIDVQEKNVYEPVERDSTLNIFADYLQKLSSREVAPYEKEDCSIPDFSNLHTLQFFDLCHVDNAALFKCVKGSPSLQIFTVSIKEVNSPKKEQLDDDFVGRIAPMLRWVQEVILAYKSDIIQFNSLKLTSTTVAHLVHFCQDIHSISRVTDWNMTMDEVEGLNCYFKKRNFVLRLH